MNGASAAQRSKRDALFLKGPITFGWIRQNIPDPTSRLILVAEAFMNMHSPALTALEPSLKVGQCAGIDSPDQRARVLIRLIRNARGIALKGAWEGLLYCATAKILMKLHPNEFAAPILRACLKRNAVFLVGCVVSCHKVGKQSRPARGRFSLTLPSFWFSLVKHVRLLYDQLVPNSLEM